MKNERMMKMGSWGTSYSLVQLQVLTVEYISSQTDRQADRQTDDSIMPIADHTACRTISTKIRVFV